MRDLRPNIGLWWYFFIEIFNDFRTFFLFVFHAQTAVFAIPIAVKLRSAERGWANFLLF